MLDFSKITVHDYEHLGEQGLQLVVHKKYYATITNENGDEFVINPTGDTSMNGWMMAHHIVDIAQFLARLVV
jgi:hypothetical protein